MTTISTLPIVKPDLAVTVRDIQASTASPKPGADLSFKITVRNIAKGSAPGAKVLCVLRADGKPAGQKEFTVDVKPDGSASVIWAVKTPEARQLALEVSVAHAQDASAGNNKASLTVNVAQ